jgi:hypothetical protein
MDHSLAGEWVHQKIDAAAQSELLPVEAARAQPNDESLDVVCEPGTVVAASAARARRTVGLDATSAMLDQARAQVAERNLVNVEWQLGDVYRLRFVEIAWVCRSNGRVVLCDREASPRSNSKMVGWLVWLQKTSGSRSGGVEFRIFRI